MGLINFLWVNSTMGMWTDKVEDNIEKRYERKAKVRPCSLGRQDLLSLAQIIQETFTKPEIERYFRVSTTLGAERIFSNSMEDFLNREELSDKVNDLSFWIEGWDNKSRFDKNVLLDFSRFSVQLHVEGTDPVWVYDKYTEIMKFLNNKTAWYWPVITLEKLIIFSMTMILIASLFISFARGGRINYLGKIALLSVWSFFIFYDTRKIWPYSFLRLRGPNPVLSKENILMAAIIALLIIVILEDIILPFFK